MAKKKRFTRAINNVSQFQNIPTEIVQMILNLLSPVEWKALRLTSKILDNHAAHFLFRRVRLSALQDHLDALVQISSLPHLMGIPRQLIWYEINVNVFADDDSVRDRYQWLSSHHEWAQGESEHSSTVSFVESEAGEIYPAGLSLEELHRLLEEDRSQLWWPMAETPFAAPQWYGLAKKEFPESLSAALGRLSNLHTIISTPCDLDFPLSKSAYPITANATNYKLPMDAPNVGLLAMLENINEFKLPIRTLLWTDQLLKATTKSLCQHHVPAFKNLTRIELCLNYGRGSRLQVLGDCLRAAADLTHLKLCFEQTGCPEAPLSFLEPIAPTNSATEPKSQQPQWRRLASLELTNMRFWEETIVGLIDAHAQTLRHLSLQDCNMIQDRFGHANIFIWDPTRDWKQLFDKLAGLQKLSLSSLKILHTLDTRDVILVPADSLRDYVNNSGPSPFNPRLYHWQIDTHRAATVDDVCSADLDLLDLEIKRRRQLQRPKRAKGTPAQWFTDLEYRNIIDATMKELEVGKEGEGEGEAGDEEDEEDDACRRTWFSLEHSDSGVLGEELEATSYWNLAAVGNHVIWWDEKTPVNACSYETELWLFERDDGSFAYGRDPWNFFEDWDGESLEPKLDCDVPDPSPGRALRDTATETPFGPAFEAFCARVFKEDRSRRHAIDLNLLQCPDHAVVLVNEKMTVPWPMYKALLSSKKRFSWEDISENQIDVKPRIVGLPT